MSESFDRSIPDLRADGSPDASDSLRQWMTPSIDDLPRLENLTLQTGAGIGPSEEGFKYV